jgi:predicted Zn-dependent protease
MDRPDAAGPDPVRWAARVRDLAHPGERLDVYASRTSRAATRLGGPYRDVPRSGEFAALLRLSVAGRDAYVALAGPDEHQAADALRLARALVPHGRQHDDPPAAFADAGWDPAGREDPALGNADRAGTLRGIVERVRDSVESGGPATVGDLALLEEHASYGYASTHAPDLRYRRSLLTLRVFVDRTVDGQRYRALATAYAHRTTDLDVPGAVRGARWQVDALAAGTRPVSAAAAGQRLLLTPPVAARLLGVLARDLTDGVGAAVPGGLAYPLVDDGRAAGAPHAALFDHEGSLTGRLDLVDTGGTVRRLRSRGPGAEGRAGTLTGHATRQVYQTVPQPWPRNVFLPGQAAEPGDDAAAWFGYDLRGDGVSHMRTGGEITLRVDTAVRDPAAVYRTGVLVIRATAGALLAAVREAGRPVVYQQLTEFSAGGGWTVLDTSRLRCEMLAGSEPPR